MMADGRNRQRELPLGEADAGYAERWNDLMIALSRIGSRCDLHMKDFCQWVFRATAGGVSGSLQRSYQKLGERPVGLCCGRDKVRSTVEEAERLGLVNVERCRRRDGAQLENAYTINWAGVRRIVLGRLAESDLTHPRVSETQGPGSEPTHYKEQEVSEEESQEENSGTGPGAVPEPNERSTAATAGQSLSVALCSGSPILMEAGSRRIDPLPASEPMQHSIFGRDSLRLCHVDEPLRMVRWWREQLSTSRPATGDSEADLLLCVAAAIYVKKLPEAEIRKSRPAALVSIISRRTWTVAIQCVPEARKLLSEAASRYGAGWLDRLCDPPRPRAQAAAVERGAEASPLTREALGTKAAWFAEVARLQKELAAER